MAQAFQADGSLLASGGIFRQRQRQGECCPQQPGQCGHAGLSAKLANDRYYATMITVADGRQLIMGGSYPYQVGRAIRKAASTRG